MLLIRTIMGEDTFEGWYRFGKRTSSEGTFWSGYWRRHRFSHRHLPSIENWFWSKSVRLDCSHGRWLVRWRSSESKKSKNRKPDRQVFIAPGLFGSVASDLTSWKELKKYCSMHA